MSSVVVRMLGPLHLTIHGRDLHPPDLGGPRAKQVLELLLVNQGQAVGKDRIVDAVWGDRAPRNPMATLENCISGLRRTLGGPAGAARQVLVTEPGAYRFSLDGATVDLWTFDQALAGARARDPGRRHGALREAIALVRGDLLDDEPYADWARPLRDLYRERHIQALVDAAEDLAVAREFADAISVAEQALRVDPVRERAHRTVILARYALGEQVLATRAYDRCRAVLVDTIGAPPLPETESLYLSVLNQEPLAALLPPLPTATKIEPSVPRSPITRYASAGKLSIAYQVVGDGPIDLVFMPGSFSHVEVGWEEPRYARFLHDLAGRYRLVLFDKRGTGMSDPGAWTDSLDDRADDIRAVMDAARSEQAVLFGVSEGAPMAVTFAVSHPDRVSGLVLYASFARLTSTDDYPWAWSSEFLELFKDAIDALWRTGRDAGVANPTITDDPLYADWIARYFRLAASPSTAKAIVDYFATIDIRHVLPDVTAPTLVIHRADEKWVDPANGRYVACQIPDARYLEVPGVDHWPWVGDADAVLRPVHDFLANLPNRPAARASTPSSVRAPARARRRSRYNDHSVSRSGE